jgi:hypothetical protein
MPQVQYVGTCNKQDSIRGIGLHWEPGQTRHVTHGVAERLLRFSDTWKAIEKEADDNDPIDLIEDEKPCEEPLPVVDFHSMSKDAMVEFAARNYGEKLDKRQTADTLRLKLVGLFGKYELDNEGKK